MARALVTGASGFVGWNVARALVARGWDVRCLVRAASRLELLEPLGVELVRGSLDDPESLSAAASERDVVFHIAGRTSALNPAEYTRDNVEGTRRLAESIARLTNPPTLVMTSSLAAGGPGTLARPRRESDGDAPVSDYGRSKLAAERAAAEFADRAAISFVRPPMVFGDADHASLTLFRQLKMFPIHPVPGLRGFAMSVVHVSDLCEAMIRVAERGERCVAPDSRTNGAARPGQGVYYVAAERTITYGELGKLAAAALNTRAWPTPLPRIAFQIAGLIGETVGRARGRAALVNMDKAREATACGWVCSDEKIRRDLDYRPTATLEQRFDETVAWYREHGWL